MTAALVDDLAGIGVEFEKSCKHCDNTAEWIVWAKHPLACQESTAFHCCTHKEMAEEAWIAALDEGWVCPCGHRHEGQLSDNFRSIRL